MNRSEQINELATALTKAQSAFGNVPKTKTARIPTKAGGEYSYNYSDLADILDMVRKPLAENGLSITQMPTSDNGVCAVYTQLSHSSGQWLGDTIRYPVSAGDIKLLGTAITYLRRYALAAMLGLASDDDDDGTGAAGASGTTRARARNGAAPSNGQHTNGNGAPTGGASEAQIKAIFGIWRKYYDGDVKAWIAENYNGKHADQLTKAEASAIIEALKPKDEAAN